MAIFIYEEFLKDLRTAGDATFARRVLSKVLDTNCNFPDDADDHRYDGIDNAWIRYVSAGKTALRVIFIRDGASVYLYRAGPHSVEDNLTSPNKNAKTIPVVSTPEALADSSNGSDSTTAIPPEISFPGMFLENYRQKYIRTTLLSRRFTKHRSVILVSPFLSPELFSISSPFGKVLTDLVDEGAKLSLITLPPQSLDELRFFEGLEANGFDVLFHDRLHAKLYLFEVDPDFVSYDPGTKCKNLAMLGSANLTVNGIGLGGTGSGVSSPNEELVYELPSSQFQSALDYATYLSVSANDIPRQRVRITLSNRKKQNR